MREKYNWGVNTQSESTPEDGVYKYDKQIWEVNMGERHRTKPSEHT